MSTIYVDKFTAIEVFDTSVRIRHHSHHMQIDTTLERDEIQAIAQLKPQLQTVPSTLVAVAIKTSDEQVVIVPALSDDDASTMMKALGEFWEKN